MFAGKSTELLRRIRMLELADKRILRVKYQADCRYENGAAIATHAGEQSPAVPVTTLAELGDSWKDYDVVGIDEG